MDDRTVRLALERHWDASDAGDFKVEHEIREGLVANETQYFADRFDPAPSQAHLAERTDDITPPR